MGRRRRAGRGAVRPGRVLAAAGRGRARFLVRQGRPAGHAHGPGRRRERRAVAGARRRARHRRRAVDLWRRTPEPAHRPRDRGAPRRAAADPHRAAGRTDRQRDAARRQQDPSGHAQLPGDPHPHQPRTGRPRSRARRSPGQAQAGRPPGGDQLPLAGRPHRQAVHEPPRQGPAEQPPPARSAAVRADPAPARRRDQGRYRRTGR